MIENLKKVAAIRHEIHKHHKSSRPLSEDYELIGLVGEYRFEVDFGYPMDLSIKPQGDGKVDFHIALGTLDVKTAEKAYNLLREKGVRHAKILVLGQFNRKGTTASLLGWEYDSEMVKCPYKDFGYGIINHYKHHSKLRPMWVLKQLDDFVRRLNEHD